MPTSKVVGIDHISIRVSDYAKSKAFYSKLFSFLGFEISEDYGSTIGWTNGKTRYWIAEAEGRKSHQIGDVGLHHYAFELRNRRDVDALQAFLEKQKVKIVDPAGLKLEGMKYGELTARKAQSKSNKSKSNKSKSKPRKKK